MVNKKKILIGSADPDFAFGIKSQLEAMGAFSPVLVTGARELIEVEQLFYFSVILLDALLDDFPGFEVCRKLREAGRDTPIILFSRIPEQECAKIRNSWQADRCAVKSIPVPDLFDRIREVIEAKAKPGTQGNQAGQKPEEEKEEKFDGLDEMIHEDLLAEISPDSPPDFDEMPEIPLSTEPEPAASTPIPLPASEAAGPPRDFTAAAPPVPDTPAAPTPLDEKISSELDEVEEEEGPRPSLLSRSQAGPSNDPDLREEPEEAAREPEVGRGAEIIPEPDSAGEKSSIAEEITEEIPEEIPKETGRREPALLGQEFVPSKPGEDLLPPMAMGNAEQVSPADSEAGAGRYGFVPWGSALKILVILVGLGFVLGYFLAR